MSLIERAKALIGTPGWEPYKFEKVSNGIVCTGAVCPLITRGKRKGQPNWRKRDRTTIAKVWVATIHLTGSTPNRTRTMALTLDEHGHGAIVWETAATYGDIVDCCQRRGRTRRTGPKPRSTMRRSLGRCAG